MKSIWIFLFLSLITHSISAGNVKDYGAKGDGVSDDTQAILVALDHMEDGVLYFPQGQYVISKTISIVLEKTGVVAILGGGGASIQMAGPGPAFHFVGQHTGTADPNTVNDVAWDSERMPSIKDIEIVGRHPLANGIELSYTMQFVVESVLIREVVNGIHLTQKNRNILIEGSHIYNCSGIGIYLDEVNIHQININNCHISYNDRSGIKVRGGEIRNFQITGNDIEYNYALDGLESADICIDASLEGSSIREGVINGNTIQAMPSPGGCNIRFQGQKNNPNKIGLWSVVGNHISNQTVNILLDEVRGVSLTGNTFIRGYDRHVVMTNSKNIVLANNVFDHNDDYFLGNLVINGGISMTNVQNISCNGLLLDGVDHDKAIDIQSGSDINIANCQFRNIHNTGIGIRNSRVIHISDCIFKSSDLELSQNIGVKVNGESRYVNVSNNIFQMGQGQMIQSDIRSKKFYMFLSNMEVK